MKWPWRRQSLIGDRTLQAVLRDLAEELPPGTDIRAGRDLSGEISWSYTRTDS
jgi:hypothetical protein